MGKPIVFLSALIITILLISLVSAFSLNDFSDFFKNFWQKISREAKITGMVTESPTATPIPTPTPKPSPTPTPMPTPTPSPEASPTPSPTASPIESPTPIETPSSTPEPITTQTPSATPIPQSFAELELTESGHNVFEVLAAVFPEVSIQVPETEEIKVEATKEEKSIKMDIYRQDTDKLVAELIKTKDGQVDKLDIKFVL